MEYYVHTRYGPWHRLRVQVAGGLVAAFAPYLLRLAMIWGDPNLLVGANDGIAVLHLTFVLSLLCILAGSLIMRSMSRYPGVEGSASILPAFSAAFGVMLLVLVMGRIEYNRFVLAGSYGLVLLWFYLVHFKEQRRSLRIGEGLEQRDVLQTPQPRLRRHRGETLAEKVLEVAAVEPK